MTEEQLLVFGDENPVAKRIRDLLEVGNFEAVEIITPQFERVDGKQITFIPKTVAEYDALKKCPDNILKDIGVSRFDDKLWLYPGEWYEFIPEGYIIIDIFGSEEAFKPGDTDDDIRLGCLAYGFVKETKHGL